ncbi:MAG: DUF624 domain-containing protein, partial [Lachnospiraceae bacterium]|nr:DUF624 domain-containing protein [Lachnospiraceae bacterium]
WTGLLWLLLCLPVFTVPMASMAAYQTMSRAVRGEQAYVTDTFFRSFARYFKKWTGFALLELLILAWLLFDCIYLYGYGTEFSQVLSYIIYGFLLLFVALNAVLYPCASRFGGSRFTVFKLAFYIVFRHLLASVALLLLAGLCVYGLFLLPRSILLAWCVLLLPGAYWFAASIIMEPVLRRYTVGTEAPADKKEAVIQKRAEASEEEDGDGAEARPGRPVLHHRAKEGSSVGTETKDEGSDDSSIVEKIPGFWDRIIRK